MSMGKVLLRIATTPNDDPREDLRDLRHAFVGCAGRLAASEVGPFVDHAEALLPRVPIVDRIAFARPMAASHYAPRPIIMLLLNDNHMVSAAILERSPLIDDAQVAGLLKTKGRAVKLAAAKRPAISVGVTDLVMDDADLTVCRALAWNRSARISKKSLAKLMEVAREDDVTRAALGLRRDLPSAFADQLRTIHMDSGAGRIAALSPRDIGFGLGRAGFVMTRKFATGQKSSRSRGQPRVLSYS